MYTYMYVYKHKPGGNILRQYESLQKGGQKSTILKNIGVKILQLLGVLKEGSQKSMILKKKYLWEGDQNSTSSAEKGQKKGSKFYKSEMGVKILHCWKIGVKILQCLKKGGQYSTSDPLK